MRIKYKIQYFDALTHTMAVILVFRPYRLKMEFYSQQKVAWC